ncbi:MAG: HAMP domain-containing sensor histidine kinase, partial [Chitinophagaceae bacterium]
YQDMQQFTFALAHDLKNSLTKLKLSLTLLKEEEIPPSINNYIQIIHRSADRLETIMLSLNKIIEVGDSSPHVVKNISPALVFSDAYDEFSDTIEMNEAFVNTDFTGIGELNYIEVYLKSIFTNLLSNAIKYSSPERPLYLTILATQKEDKAIFTFTDNGQGIDLEKFGNKLFLPFTRFSSNTDGSGVGLYLIKNIAERNGGSIEVESTPGKGSSFTVTIREYKLPV